MTHNAHDDQTEAAGQAPRSTAVKKGPQGPFLVGLDFYAH